MIEDVQRFHKGDILRNDWAGVKVRTAKKRIHRHVKWFARHKIPLAFKNSRERKAWIKEICDYHISRL